MSQTTQSTFGWTKFNGEWCVGGSPNAENTDVTVTKRNGKSKTVSLGGVIGTGFQGCTVYALAGKSVPKEQSKPEYCQKCARKFSDCGGRAGRDHEYTDTCKACVYEYCTPAQAAAWGETW